MQDDFPAAQPYPKTAPDSITSVASPPSIRTFWDAVKLGVRLLLLRREAIPEPFPNLHLVLWPLLLTCLLAMLSSYLELKLDKHLTQFSWYPIYQICTHLFLILALGTFMRPAAQSGDIPAWWLLFTSNFIWLIPEVIIYTTLYLLYAAIWLHPKYKSQLGFGYAIIWFSYIALSAWGWIAVSVLYQRWFQPRRGALYCFMLGFACVCALPFVQPRWQFFQIDYLAENQQQPSLPAIETEKNLDLQTTLLAQTLGQLESTERSEDITHYFVAYAPDDAQDVFMKEALAIQKLMDERFGTTGKSIVLINHRTTTPTHLWAMQHHLQLVLNTLGKRMGENDLLTLYITAHGSQQHKLSADFGLFQLEELNAGKLDKILKEAAIPNTALFISACYSGGLIPKLSAPNRFIATAADATHTSFGCDSSLDYTYFGKAVFDEALRQTYDYSQAFQSALPVIRQRELKNKYEPSNPQMFMGEAIAPLLARFARTLAEKP